MRIQELQNLLQETALDDIVVVGFLDSSERPVRFHPLYRTLFLECGTKLLKISVIGDTGRLLIAKVDTMSWEHDLDNDMQPACSSVRQSVLEDPDGSNRLIVMNLWDASELESGVECAAARFDLANDQKIFLDPSYHFGIRIGGLGQQAIWSENSRSADHILTEARLSAVSG